MGVKWEEALKGLPADLMKSFNKMNNTARQYTVNRILGFSKVDSIKNAGSQAKDRVSLQNTAQSLEERHPEILDIIEYCEQNNFESQLLRETSQFSQEVSKKAKENELAMKQLEHASAVMSPNMAESVAFYQRVVNGSIKSYKTTETYDKDGKLIGKKREIIDDVDAKMRAREKLDRMLGLNAIKSLEQVQVGSICINIVDASKKEEDDTPPVDVQDDAIVKDEVVIEHEPEVIDETPKEEKPKKEDNRKPLYYIDEKGQRRRRPSWER